jgi:hypothetical protein
MAATHHLAWVTVCGRSRHRLEFTMTGAERTRVEKFGPMENGLRQVGPQPEIEGRNNMTLDREVATATDDLQKPIVALGDFS